jgi:hypothetical protein
MRHQTCCAADTFPTEQRSIKLTGVQVFGVTWNSHITDRNTCTFATWGKEHVRLWTQNSTDGKLTWHANQISFGAFELQNVHSLAFLPTTHALVLGLARGTLLLVERLQAVRSIIAHRPGAQLLASDGSFSYSGVRGMALHAQGKVLLTAGAPSGLRKYMTTSPSDACAYHEVTY